MRGSTAREGRAGRANGTRHRHLPRAAFRDRDKALGGALDQDELLSGSGVAGARGPKADGRAYPPGPKGYRRSDERIREDICDELMLMADLDCSDVEVAVRGGEVSLDGTVPERSMKFRIEQVCARCAGVVEISNRIRLRRS